MLRLLPWLPFSVWANTYSYNCPAESRPSSYQPARFRVPYRRCHVELVYFLVHRTSNSFSQISLMKFPVPIDVHFIFLSNGVLDIYVKISNRLPRKKTAASLLTPQRSNQLVQVYCARSVGQITNEDRHILSAKEMKTMSAYPRDWVAWYCNAKLCHRARARARSRFDILISWVNVRGPWWVSLLATVAFAITMSKNIEEWHV